ncbi:hypothetical protein F5Y11DRAFT_204485, partial [Daldinia sp. FL1419]
MRLPLSSVLTIATLSIAFASPQQRVIAHSTSMKIEDAPSMASAPPLINSNSNSSSTDPLPQHLKPLTTAAPLEKASVMGLIVFSAAGLYLL